MGIFDFLTPRGNEIRAARAAAADLAERKFDLEERKFTDQQEKEQKSQAKIRIDSLREQLKSSGLSPQGKQFIGKMIEGQQFPGFEKQFGSEARQAQADASVGSLKAGLFSGLRSGDIELRDVPAALQGADRDLQSFVEKPVNLFDFAGAPKTKAEQEAIALSKVTAGKTPENELDIIRGIKPPSQKETIDEIQDIQDAVANANMVPEAGAAQIQALVRSNPEVFENIDIDTLTKLPGIKKSALFGGVDPFFEKSVKTEIEKDMKSGIETLSGLVSTLEGFQRGYLTGKGKIKGKVGRMLDFFDKPNLLGTKKFTDGQSAFIRQAKSGFLVFRKWITGVAGGIKEFKEIGKAFPDADSELFKGDTPSQFQAKSMSAIESGMRAINLMKLMRNEGLDVAQDTVTAAIRRLPLDRVPLGLKEGDTIDSVLGNQTVEESLSTRLSALKKAQADGKATVGNAPTKNSQPQTTEEKIELQETSKAVKKQNGIRVEELLVSHPLSISAMRNLVKEEKMELSQVADFLQFIKTNKLSDEQVIQRLKRMGGSK